MHIKSINLKKISKSKALILLLTMLTFLGTSLAAVYYIYYFQDTRDNTLATGLISIDYQDGAGVLNLENTVPVIDEVGIENDPYVFSVKNTSFAPINLKIQLIPEDETTIHLSAVRYALYVNDEFIKKDTVASLEDNTLYIYENLKTKETIDVKLVFWVDYYYENQNDTFSARVKVTGESFDFLFSRLNEEFEKVLIERPNSYIEEDGIKYISGSKDDYDKSTTDDIDFNYVWYSGKLWRITQINPDGTMKMITDDRISVLNWGETTTYSTSWMREWLNQEFLPTLNSYESIIDVDAGWYSITDNVTPPTKPTGEYTVTDSVGLLSAYEYYKSYEKLGDYTNGYLRSAFSWRLITPHDSSNVWGVSGSTGAIVSTAILSSTNDGTGVRPSINLKADIEFVGGDGSYNDPYTIKGYGEAVVEEITLLNTRQSGEYVKIDDDLDSSRIFRIVGTELVGENLTTKLILNDYLKTSGTVVTKYLSNDYTYGGGTSTTYWDYYLNNTFLGTLNTNMLEKGTYYLGMYSDAVSYKATVCSSIDSTKSTSMCIKEGNVVSNTWTGYVGLPRIGEMFGDLPSDYGYTTSTATNMWLITPYSSSKVHFVYKDGGVGNNGVAPASNSAAVRPTINLKSTVVIKSGSGTKEDPYVVGIPNTKEFKYNSSVQYYVYNVENTGKYQIELWGARGGYGRRNAVQVYAPGNGGYTSGEIELTQGDTLYIYLGGMGGSPGSTSITGGSAGYNGGGKGGNDSNGVSGESNNEPGGGGGGATDIRYFGTTTPTASDLTWNSTLGLNSRIMVAAGGAGSAETSVGGYAGGLTGGIGGVSASTPGSQTGGYAFGQGASGSNSYTGGPGGGGGGYYGGKAGTANDSTYVTYGGSGGSSFISGHTGSVAITSSSDRTPRIGTDGAACANDTTDNLCSVHYSGKVFTDTVMIAGNASMPSTSGEEETGHSGHGYARITYLGE